ncbi:MAG: MarC family protein [Campylobacterales bacterium]
MEQLFFYTISLLTILNPLAAAAILVSIVECREIPEVARRTSLTVLVGLIITMVGGGAIMKLFGINIPSIKVIGGIVLMLMAIHMIQGREMLPTKGSEEEHQAAIEKEDVSIVPMAIPILLGPGAVTTTIVLSQKAETFPEKSMLLIAILINSGIVYLSLRYSATLSRGLGVHGIKIITRLMGLVIGAVASLFLVGGVKELWIGG